MDQTGRKITKIAREVGKFTVQTMKEEGIGTAEFDFIHLVRHNPGITQTEVRETLKIDKGAAARSLPEKRFVLSAGARRGEGGHGAAHPRDGDRSVP